jgi:hypothetical protein
MARLQAHQFTSTSIVLATIHTHSSANNVAARLQFADALFLFANEQPFEKRTETQDF